jgi:hypothetical protein
MWFKNNWFKLLAIVVLCGAFARLPYGYYQALRWVVAGAAAYSVFLAWNAGKRFWVGASVLLAVLFNPIAPFYLTTDTWQLFDLAAVAIFGASLRFGSTFSLTEGPLE